MNKLLLISLSAVLVGCASSPPRNFAPPTDYVSVQQIVIPVRFNKVPLSASNLALEANKCVPALNDNSQSMSNAKNKLFDKNTSLGLGHVSHANVFFISNGQGTCMQQTTSRYPIWAAEAFYETANPTGVPPTITNQWYARLAERIATRGTATAVYALPNGNANIVTYWVDASGKNMITIYYSSEFKRAGSWQLEQDALKFEHPTMSGSVMVTRGSGKSSEKNVLNN